MSFDPHGVLAFGLKNPVYVVAATVLALVVLAIMWRAGRGLARALQRALKGKRPEDILVFIVAGLVTAICAQGMFKFFGDKLHMPLWMQVLCFGVLELAMLTCALRARRRIRAMEPAGVDGALVWVIAAISALLSATDATGAGVVARLVLPFVAAVMWHLALAYEKRRSGKSAINWTITPEKLLVRLGVADPSHRSTGEADTHRKLNIAAVAAYRLDVLQKASAATWRITRAHRKQQEAMQSLMASTDYVRNHSLQDELRTMIAILKNASTLADLQDPPPWERQDPATIMWEDARVRFSSLIAGVPPIGTERPAELGTGTGTDDEPETGTAGADDAGTDTDEQGGTDTGTEERERPVPKPRRRTGRRTGIKPGGGDKRAAQLDRARELNTAHMREHSRPISGDKLAAELHVSKTVALGLLREVKRPREVRPDDVAS